MKTRRYSELRQLQTFEERYNYLRLIGEVGVDTFGFDRYLNQMFYRSSEWKQVRQQVILRDGACDLGVPGFEINDKIYIHHMNPIDVNDISNATDFLLNPEFLITTTFQTHNAIHYGSLDSIDIPRDPIVRRPNDTCPWR